MRATRHRPHTPNGQASWVSGNSDCDVEYIALCYFAGCLFENMAGRGPVSGRVDSRVSPKTTREHEKSLYVPENEMDQFECILLQVYRRHRHALVRWMSMLIVGLGWVRKSMLTYVKALEGWWNRGLLPPSSPSTCLVAFTTTTSPRRGCC